MNLFPIFTLRSRVNLFPIFTLLRFTLAANGITIDVTTSLNGAPVLTLQEQEPVRVSALKDRILTQRPDLLRIQIDLMRDIRKLQDTEEIIESANINLLISQVS